MDNNRNFFNVNPIQSVRQNPFTGQDNLTDEPKPANNRLNGYDSSLLNNKTLPEANTDKLKIEYKISERQRDLLDLSSKIKNAELYGTQNEVLSLKVRKQRIERELFELNRQQAEKNNPVKSLTGEVIELPWIRKAQTFLSKNVLAKVSKKFNSIVFLGESLEKLSDINRNVDELIEMRVPYGEKKENYEKLTQYLYQANQIHSQISKTMSSMK